MARLARRGGGVLRHGCGGIDFSAVEFELEDPSAQSTP
jgi:hypothetical protein